MPSTKAVKTDTYKGIAITKHGRKYSTSFAPATYSSIKEVKSIIDIHTQQTISHDFGDLRFSHYLPRLFVESFTKLTVSTLSGLSLDYIVAKIQYKGRIKSVWEHTYFLPQGCQHTTMHKTNTKFDDYIIIDFEYRNLPNYHNDVDCINYILNNVNSLEFKQQGKKTKCTLNNAVTMIGDSRLEAVLRCFVAYHLGDSVMIPDAILNKSIAQ